MTVFDLSAVFSRIRVRGRDRLDFLHRMSSGDLLGLRPGEGRTTVFTTPIGRMVDYAAVLADEDSLLLLSGGSGQGKLVRWLHKYIFFNDDVQLEDESAACGMFGYYGQDASGFGPLLAAPRYTHQSTARGIVVSAPPLVDAGCYLIGEAPGQSEHDLAPLAEYEDRRIHAGYPAFPNEINEDHIPLEAGLLDAVSFTKGCYIGQEIIARMESRKQLARRLAVIEAEGGMVTGAVIRSGEDTLGAISSAATDGRVALGYVRSQYAQTGQELGVGAVAARVARLAGMV